MFFNLNMVKSELFPISGTSIIEARQIQKSATTVYQEITPPNIQVSIEAARVVPVFKTYWDWWAGQCNFSKSAILLYACRNSNPFAVMLYFLFCLSWSNNSLVHK